jgi:hypothetical protein
MAAASCAFGVAFPKMVARWMEVKAEREVGVDPRLEGGDLPLLEPTNLVRSSTHRVAPEADNRTTLTCEDADCDGSVCMAASFESEIDRTTEDVAAPTSLQAEK